MKRNLIGLLILLALVGVFLAPVTLEAKSKTQYAAGGLFLWLGSPGTAICVGGTPTGTFPPCSEGTRMSIWRDYDGPVWFGDVTGSAASFITGTYESPWISHGACNLDRNLAGPCWGTFEGSALGGQWEGTWDGVLDFVNFGGEVRFVGYGTGGGVEGLHLMLEAVAEGGGDPNEPMPFTARVFKVQD
jgi:hypothetical protein